jgi:zinc protease
MTRDDLYRHYRQHYQPGNAVLALAGAFDSGQMLDRIEALFGSIPGNTPEPLVTRAEPVRLGEHRLEVEGPGDTTFVEIAYPAPAGNEEDFFTFLVMDSLMTGASNLNMFGGGLSNKTSRLYQSLVDHDLAVSVGGGVQATADPFLYEVIVMIHPERTVEQALNAFDEQIARIKSEPAPLPELERAVKQARALFAYGSESVTNQAFWLGFAEMFDSYKWFETYLDRLAAVTPADVQRVAEKYLRRQQRVVGIFRPQDEEPS